MNRFHREDIETFKKKFLLVCNTCEFKLVKYQEEPKRKRQVIIKDT